MSKGRCTRRAAFTSADDKALLRFLIAELKNGSDDARNPFGNRIWQTAVDKKVLTHGNRSLTSIRDHFRRQVWPYLDLQAITSEERAYLKKALRVSWKEETATSPSGNEEENEDSIYWLFNVESLPNKKTGLKRNVEDVRRSVESKRREDASAKKRTPVVSFEEAKTSAQSKRSCRQLFPTAPILDSDQNIEKPAEQPAAIEAEACVSGAEAEKLKGQLDKSSDEEVTDSVTVLPNVPPAAARSEAEMANGSIVAIDIESPGTKAALLKMMQSGSLGLAQLPAFLNKLKKMSEIAVRYGSTVEKVQEHAQVLKSLTLVERRLKSQVAKKMKST